MKNSTRHPLPGGATNGTESSEAKDSAKREPKETSSANSQGVHNAPKLDTEEADASVFESVMRRAKNEAASTDYLKVSEYRKNNALPRKSLNKNFRSSAKRVTSIQKMKSARNQIGNARRKEKASRAHDLLESIRHTALVTALFPTSSQKDLLLSQVDKRELDEEDNSDDESKLEQDGEDLPLTGADKPRYGSVARALTRARSHRKRKTCAGHWNQRVRDACHPENLVRILVQVITHFFFVVLGIPCLVLSWIFFYHLGNPELDFLPGHASLAWWLNFVCRQTVTMDFARISQWILLDCLILGSRIVTKLVGPAISLFCIQAKGWPVVVIFWALFDLTILHGDNKYCTHWLYWTGLKIYSMNDAINTGSYVLSSPIFLRFLLALLLAGLASSVKRFSLALIFSQRQCLEFKPRLETILVEMMLANEVASLAEQAAMIQNNAQLGVTGEIDLQTDQSASGIQIVGFGPTDGGVSFEEEEVADENTEKASPGNMMRNGQLLKESSSGRLGVKRMLDPWEPPVDKSEKTEVSIRDILLFQAALTCMNDDKPFGEAFGPASDRNECILSSQHVYTNLLSLNTSENTVLDFEVLALATCDDEGMVDPGKKKLLRRLFRPDAKNQVTELAFIQSCDAIYKRLSYFRASVGNASVIVNVLAGIVDVFFFCMLALALLSLLEFNPWALLVPFTSLVVSLSFALSSSLSKYLEGVMLIADTRPFDLGDRIYIGPADTMAHEMNVDMSSNTWFVEGITLSTTTLRYARTDEVSTLNNWAIAGSKIINCNRSPGAIVVLKTKLHVSVLQGDKLEHFQAALQDYVETHPRTWKSLLFCRHDSIDADDEEVFFTYVHLHVWSAVV
jgi:small-conductance mechanosensitive channel